MNCRYSLDLLYNSVLYEVLLRNIIPIHTIYKDIQHSIKYTCYISNIYIFFASINFNFILKKKKEIKKNERKKERINKEEGRGETHTQRKRERGRKKIIIE